MLCLKYELLARSDMASWSGSGFLTRSVITSWYGSGFLTRLVIWHEFVVLLLGGYSAQVGKHFLIWDGIWALRVETGS